MEQGLPQVSSSMSLTWQRGGKAARTKSWVMVPTASWVAWAGRDETRKLRV